MYPIIGKAVLIFVALWWCKVVIFRLGKDIREFRSSDYTGKIPVVIIWIVTILIILWLATHVWGNIRAFFRYI